jgi:cellulose biosynthesis protein BcsQ
MPKMQLILLEQDAYFIDMCSSYIRTSEHAETFTMSVFTSKEQGFAFIERSQEPYILLVHESFMPLPEQAFQKHNGCLIILSDTPVAVDIVEYPVLCKFQPLNRLVSHILSHFNEYSSNRMLIGNRNSQVISVYSAVGGSGKTLAAMHLARELVYQGMRVFYMNLESLPSCSWLVPGETGENHFSRMLYYGKSNTRLQTAKVERLKNRHKVMGFDYFPGCCEPDEMEEMTETDTGSIIKSVQDTGAYDCILLDLESTLHPRIRISLKLSDQVLLLSVDDRIHLEKTKRLLKLLTGMGETIDSGAGQKWKLVINKFSGSMMNGADWLQIPISGFLPYIPEWKAFNSVEALQARGAFSESLSELMGQRTPEAEANKHVVG